MQASASFRAADIYNPATGEVFRRVPLANKQDVDMAARIYKNMLDSLSQKLRSNNERLSESEDRGSQLLAASV